MDKVIENTVVVFVIDLLEAQGFSYIYAPDISPDSDRYEPWSYDVPESYDVSALLNFSTMGRRSSQ